MIVLPRLYAILDSTYFPEPGSLCAAAEDLATAGVTLMQYRNKSGGRQILQDARELKRFLGTRVKLIMNDRADLCLGANFDGVHLGQEDLSPEAARRIIGPKLWLGLSTHNAEQIAAADESDADYLAIGPVFATTSKVNPDPVVGLKGVRRARELTRKPLVAIGGITRLNARSVIDSGADSVAVISDLLLNPRKSAEAFFEVLR
jgi:thiamine-phosphate pyrophosphorylase